ncbi:MAG: hypothetical protein FD180_4464 [Planctomycetota bacterium]|nr:MAG: hypothetical protein FD180_4464 [Planctomycetota bacterium]
MAADKDQTIGRLAVSRGIISQSQLRQCLEEQGKAARPLPLAVILLKKGFLDDRDLETLMEASERIAGAKTTSQENSTAKDETGSKASAYSDALGSLIDSGEGKAIKPPQRSRTVDAPGGMGIAAMADALDTPPPPRRKAAESSGPSLLGDSLSAMDAMEAAPKKKPAAPPPEEPAARRKPASEDNGPASFDKVSVGTGLVNTSALPDLDDDPAPPPKRAARPAPAAEESAPVARRAGPPPADDDMLVPVKKRPTEPPKVAPRKDEGGLANYDKVSVTSGLVDTSALPDLDDDPAPPPKKAGRPAPPVEEPAPVARRGGPPPADDEMLIPPRKRPSEPPKVAAKKDDGGLASFDKVSVTSGLVDRACVLRRLSKRRPPKRRRSRLRSSPRRSRKTTAASPVSTKFR